MYSFCICLASHFHLDVFCCVFTPGCFYLCVSAGCFPMCFYIWVSLPVCSHLVTFICVLLLDVSLCVFISGSLSLCVYTWLPLSVCFCWMFPYVFLYLGVFASVFYMCRCRCCHRNAMFAGGVFVLCQMHNL